MFLFLLSILSLSTTTTAFAPQQKTHYYQQQQNQYDLLSILTNDRIYSSSLLKAKTNDKDSFDLDSLISHITDDDDDDDYDDEPIQLMAELIRPLLSSDDAIEYGADNQDATKIETGNQIAYEMAKGRFVDLCSQLEGEEKLESLFLHAAETEIGRTVLENDNHDDDDENLVQYRRIVEGAIESMQSVLVLGMTYGLTMNPLGVGRAVNHMKEDAKALDMIETETKTTGQPWTPLHSLRLKYRVISDTYAKEKTPGFELLANLKNKQTPLGAYNLLILIGVWEKHENLGLLRSGFPVRFTSNEEEVAKAVANRFATTENNENNDDPDQILGIRQDFRSQKIYTIDSASTKEIDDALGVEIINNDDDNTKRYRYWIHIADSEKFAPVNSELFEIARKRATSIYLPGASISMMPSSVSHDVMSLKAQTDACALSLGVELREDGSIIDESIILTPSTVRVSYRLTYDDADEMLEDGVGYSEEWELGQLYTAAQHRRNFRMENGSAEAFVPTQIPQYTVSTFPDQNALDGVGIKVDVQVSHNGGKNQSAIVADTVIGGDGGSSISDELPVSSASTLVTEMMILAGEAIGKWAQRETQTNVDNDGKINSLELPFRGQPDPDYRSRGRDRNIMMDLLECNIGDGYCHAWYSRRFLSPAKVTPEASSHSGLGLDCYVQWSSPIRRFQDLQVHAAVKRFIRRQKVIDLLTKGEKIPTEITSEDLGCELRSPNNDGKLELSLENIDKDINYNDKTKLLGPAKFVMRNSNKFWMLEYVRRLKDADPELTLEALVLGCVNPDKRQYAIYIYELGLEWRYTSPVGIQAGDRFKIRIGDVIPANGQMAVVRSRI
ncbi:MAG: hypothetical protein ACI8RD_009710 [Bacillariaceae sp.]|jgi:hypothetical protein